MTCKTPYATPVNWTRPRPRALRDLRHCACGVGPARGGSPQHHGHQMGAEVRGIDDPARAIGVAAQSRDTEHKRKTADRAQVQLLATGQPVTQDGRRTVKGRDIVVQNLIIPIRGAAGQIVRIGCASSDITELQKARNPLRRTQDSLGPKSWRHRASCRPGIATMAHSIASGVSAAQFGCRASPCRPMASAILTGRVVGLPTSRRGSGTAGGQCDRHMRDMVRDRFALVGGGV